MIRKRGVEGNKMRRKVEQEDKEKDEENEVGGVKSSGVG